MTPRSTLALALALALPGCSAPLRPVVPQTGPAACTSPLFVGRPVERTISWGCGVGQEARRGRNTDGRCIGAVSTTAYCHGNPCVTKVTAIPEYTGYTARTVVEIVPQNAGPLDAWVELRHEVGIVERRPILTCEVLPVPTVVFGCRMRDTATGAFTACPALIPVGAELHLDATVTISSGHAPLPSLDVRLDDVGLNINPPYPRGPIECTRTDGGEDPHRRGVRCAVAGVVAGAHAFTIQLQPLPKRVLSFEVAQR